MPTDQVEGLMKTLQSDSWRARVGFSDDMAPALSDLLSVEAPDALIIKALEDWLSKHQPCLFGRIAAKHGLLHFCLLKDSDLNSDDLISEKVQRARQEWTRLAFEGKASGFIVAVLSWRLAVAKPTDAVRDIAIRICSLYLQQQANVDEILLDHIYLEQRGFAPKTWRWSTGVNYFSAQADKRWWQDHRMPVGMAFSVNSVGHMVRSARLLAGMQKLDESMDVATEEFRPQNIDSLGKALSLAMQTIGKASEAPSRKATELLPLPHDLAGRPKCPIELGRPNDDKDYCQYRGFYHTDITLPSEYFREDVERPTDIQPHTLDFTYLFDNSLDNPDYKAMGEGQRIRESTVATDAENPEAYRYEKRLRAAETEVAINNAPRLAQAHRRNKSTPDEDSGTF